MPSLGYMHLNRPGSQAETEEKQGVSTESLDAKSGSGRELLSRIVPEAAATTLLATFVLPTAHHSEFPGCSGKS